MYSTISSFYFGLMLKNLAYKFCVLVNLYNNVMRVSLRISIQLEPRKIRSTKPKSMAF